MSRGLCFEFGVISHLVGWFVGLIGKNYETIGLWDYWIGVFELTFGIRR